MTLDWPAAFERTALPERESTYRFEVGRGQTIDELQREMRRLGVDDWRLSTALDHQSQNPNRPYANQPAPDDPGAVLRWTMDGDQFAVACDHYDAVRDNLRAIRLYVEEKRKMEQRPVTTGASEFANARLPSGDDPEPAGPPAHEVLGVVPDAPDSVVEAAARERIKEAHPDQGGTAADLKRVREARDELLDGRAARSDGGARFCEACHAAIDPGREVVVDADAYHEGCAPDEAVENHDLAKFATDGGEVVVPWNEGGVYHRTTDCGGIMETGAKSVPVDEAEEAGLRPCEKCFDVSERGRSMRTDGGTQVSLARIDDLAQEAITHSRRGDGERARELLRDLRQHVHQGVGRAPRE